ncbi:family 2 encapsulin nanocompartment cargo protein polyprenyl transferase [Amycolatopsis anabasis]|uniref:family 2 encapsulin nanocompartment cargo protein polyprenyl transferase n=1 Tax=Amycolatopsis anabasis TaxID=1840409 RepID=UPI00131C0F04|nr:family 2 encapsulin nanocompartment cargo protein polyprenyl transferase [Amycolatopsis anabasis]
MTDVEVVRAEGRPARELLACGRATVVPALRAAVDTLPGPMRRIAGYHFGWWDEDGRVVKAGGGKAIRPTLVLLSAEATGGACADALPAAVAVELVHNFSLLHDDVMDGDATRRHRPTAWNVFGVGPAILAGDALLTLAFDVLAASGHAASTEAARALSQAVQDLVDGQCADVAFERRVDVALAEAQHMAEEKTAALIGCTCELGALFGDGTTDQVGRLRRFGQRLGLAFQHVDDLLGIWGDPAITGKSVHSDLASHKKSLPVVAALTSGTPAGHELAALYDHDRQLSGPELARAAELVELAGGRSWSQAQADALLAQALRNLAAAGVHAKAASELGSLARLIARRDH